MAAPANARERSSAEMRIDNVTEADNIKGLLSVTRADA
jgi:hypothetical protein